MLFGWLPPLLSPAALPIPPCRLRKDPLDPIDGGTKVRIALRRMLNPDAYKAEQERKKKEEEAAKAAAGDRAGKKAGAWSGLPGR